MKQTLLETKKIKPDRYSYLEIKQGDQGVILKISDRCEEMKLFLTNRQSLDCAMEILKIIKKNSDPQME